MKSTAVIRARARRKLKISLITLIFTFAGLALAACQTQGDLIQRENALAAAGFTVHIANTAARQDMLNRLPPNQFVLRVHDGVSDYVYADPGCGCLYVGSQKAFRQYVSNQQLDITHEQQMAVQDYYDAAWDGPRGVPGDRWVHCTAQGSAAGSGQKASRGLLHQEWPAARAC